jgi:hypothetical protein
MKQYVIRDAGGLAILEQACICRDRATEFAAIIKREGVMIRGREHSLIKHEHNARMAEARLLHSLGLNVEALHPGVGRPTGRTVGVSLEHFSRDNDQDAS